jgi:HAD superfamily hydrolase (TIGR01509 family)
VRNTKITPGLIPTKELVLFDMDGTLVNSEHWHFEALIQTLDLPEDFNWHPYIGMPDSPLIQLLKPELGSHAIDQLIEQKNLLLVNLLKNKSLSELEAQVTPGARDFLQHLKARSIPASLVSASEQLIVDTLIDLLKLRPFFVELYGRESTARTKPSPSPYLHAMREHRTLSTKTLIIEDSITGLEAALCSGAQVLRMIAHLDEQSKRRYSDIQSTDNFDWLIS